MDEIHRFRILNRLKSIHRLNSVGDRKESSAEHSWSCLLLADFFLSKNDYGLDRLKVYELLMYHDVVEIEAGDTPLHPELKHTGKKEKEQKAAELLGESLPDSIRKKFSRLFHEFEEQKTKEARFAKAIDALDAEIHEIDYKKDWKGWSKEFLVEKKGHLFAEFPELNKAFYVIMEYLMENGYFDQ
ncbi:HD domain-containing protein [Candidatus Woesearchaeota archaeon]|nr:HD domain-containing protein [Candidatus Woesearchaeota archaeon]